MPCLQRRKSSALCWWGQALSLHRPAVQLWSFSTASHQAGGHLCPSHLVAPDTLKKGSLIWMVEPWDSLTLRTPPVAGTWWWPSSQQDGPSGGKSLSMTQGLLLPMAAWERKGCSLDSPSLGWLTGAVTRQRRAADGDKPAGGPPALSSLWDQRCLGGFGVPWTLLTQTPTFLPCCWLVEWCCLSSWSCLPQH